MIKRLEYDFVIIGSGAAGGTIFEKFKKQNKNTLLIEQGDYLNKNGKYNFFFKSLKKFWKFSGYQYATGNISLPLLQGISVGGSTTINGSIMQDLDENFCGKLNDLLELKNKHFSYRNLLEYQSEIKNELNITSEEIILNNQNLNEFVKNYGWSLKSQNLSKSNDSDLKKILLGNSIETHLLRKFNKQDILSNVVVIKLVLDKKKVIGINCYDKISKKKFFIKVNKNLVISCGTIGSANLLLKSKIKNNNIGKKFSCHLSGAIDSFISNKNILINNKSQALEINTNNEEFRKFALQKIPHEILLARLPENELSFYYENIDNISSWVFNVSTFSTGYFKKSFTGYNLNYDISKKEEDKIKNFIILISEFLFALGSKTVFPNLINTKSGGFKNFKELKNFITKSKAEDFLLTSSHLFGTTCIGKNDQTGVIDENFKVYGYDNLHIFDAGVFPFPTESNPQLTIMIYAKLVSDIILSK